MTSIGRTLGRHLLLLIVGMLAVSCSHEATTAEETLPGQAPIPVTVAPVATATVERVADLVGTLFANEEVTIASQLEARIEWLGPDMGDHVERDEVLLRLDGADLEAELREVEVSLAKARADNARAKTLRREGIISAELAHKMSTDAAVLEARRDVLKVKLDRTVIRSPLTGSVAARMISVGEVVQAGGPLFRIVEDDHLKFRTSVPERFAARLHLGLEVRLRVDAYPGQVFLGKITRVNPTSDANNRSILIEALVPNAEGKLKPGFFTSGDLVYDDHAPALAVPESALTTFAGLTKLFVVKDGKAEERVVQTGIAVRDHQREIVDGVREGEQVAVSNVDKLENGAPVTITDTAPVAQAAP